MDREQQLLSNFIHRYLEENQKLPTAQELEQRLLSSNLYAPISKPIVPLKGAKSNHLYIRNTILDLLQDKFNIDDLLEHLKRKISRNTISSVLEVTSLIEKTNSILNKYYRNNFNIIYNDVPILYSSADVSDFYMSILDEDVYVEEDDSPSDPIYLAQYIDIDSFNIKSGKEGLSLIKTKEKILDIDIQLSTYSEEGFITKTVLNKVNPISIILSGNTVANKGLTLSIPLSDKRISTIELDVDPVTVTVEVDGNKLFTKSLDGKSTLNINRTISENITLHLYAAQVQVHINIKNIALFESSIEAAGTYKNGEYVTLALPVGTKYGNLKFLPDQFIPKDTSITWEYSSSRLDWTLIEEDELTGGYKNIEWNSIESSSSASVENIANTSLIKLADLDDKAKNVSIKTGKDAIFFNRKESGNGSFIFYLETLDDTGYHFELGNVNTENGLFISNVTITSDTFSYNEAAAEIISVEVDAGIYKVVLEINNNIIFEPLSFYRTTSPNKNIKDILYEDFLINCNLLLGADRLNREVSLWIQGHSLTEDDLHRLSYRNPLEQINYFSTNYKKDVIVKPYTLNDNYDIILFDYNTTSNQIIPAEVHYYAYNGADWVVSLFHTPIGDVTFDEVDITPNADDTVTITGLADTTTYEKSLLMYSGTDSNAMYETEQTYIVGTPTLKLTNIKESDTFHGYKEIYSQVASVTTGANTETLDFIPLLLDDSFAVDTSKITVISQEDAEETHAITSVDISTKVITIDTANLSVTAKNVIIMYSYSELQTDETAGDFPFVHLQTETISGSGGTTNDIVLNRGPATGESETITITDGSTTITGTPSENTSLDLYTINAGSSFAVGTDVTLSYTVHIEITEVDGNLQMSNLPVSSNIKKEYTETGLAYEAVSASELILNHPGISGSSVLQVNADAAVGHTLAGNKITIDLSNYATADGAQQPIELTVVYKSYEHTDAFKAYVAYEYYKPTPYTFHYTYEMSRAVSLLELYSDATMVSQFYDISYYIAQSDNLYLKAALSSTGIESPIIRRLRFERTD